MSESRTALIIDDEEPLRRLMARVLERAGYQTLTAGDGDEGVELHAQHAEEIGLVILDVMLPSKGAAEVLPELLEARPDLSVILTSGDALPEGLEAELERIRGRFLRKPFLPKALLRTLSELAPTAAAATEAL